VTRNSWKGKAENDEERFQFLVDKRRINHSPQATSIFIGAAQKHKKPNFVLRYIVPAGLTVVNVFSKCDIGTIEILVL
jgi:hypothetical protein